MRWPNPTRWLLALATALGAAAGMSAAVQADAPRSFSITPAHGSASTGVTASFTFTVSPSDPCQGQQLNFTWDGTAWASVAKPTYIAGNGRCTASITEPAPACSQGAGPHTLAVAGALGKDTGSATYTIDGSSANVPCPAHTPTPAPTQPPTPAPVPTPTPAASAQPTATPAVAQPTATPAASSPANASPSAAPASSTPAPAAAWCAVVPRPCRPAAVGPPPPPPPPPPPSFPLAAVLGSTGAAAGAAGVALLLVRTRRKPVMPTAT